jgi:signal transduction histidine kinase
MNDRVQSLPVHPQTVGNLVHLIREMIGANIALQLNLEREGLWVKGDAEWITRVVVNLISNARDAMPEGGTITVEASRLNLGPDLVRRKVSESKDFAGIASPSEGNYVRLVVRDTGIGMDAYTKAECFNPFFTTKDVGKGTGLGLSIVYEVVKQSNGWISMESELGRATNVEVYLPEIPAPVGH